MNALLLLGLLLSGPIPNAQESAGMPTTSAGVAAKVTDETGTGALVLGTGPTISAPTISSVSGDIASFTAGAVTLADPQHAYVSTKTLTATGAGGDCAIVGNGTNSLNHAAGCELVAAPGSGKLLVVDFIHVVYTWSGATYGGGSDVTISYRNSNTNNQIVSGYSAANSFGDTSSNSWMHGTVATNGGLIADGSSFYTNASLVLRVSGAYTQPGSAAGTAKVTTVYRIVTIP